jgi:predicted DNA binding CopG/RHH family protein
MPRMRKPRSERRTEYVSIPLTEAELKRLQDRAASAGMNRTQFMRSVLVPLKAGKGVLVGAK